MYKGLYDAFRHWFHENRGTVWFYSDPHFADPEIAQLRPNYIGDDEQVRRINAKVGKYDTLVILGDIGNVDWVKRLHGYKVLIMGNHDAGASNYRRIIRPQKTEVHRRYDPQYYALGPGLYKGEWLNEIEVVEPAYDNHLFDEVYEGPLFISEKILLSHEPMDCLWAFNIHGHDHSGWDYKGDDRLNVCAERINYTPIALPQIIKSGALKEVETIHRAAINRAIAKKGLKHEIP